MDMVLGLIDLLVVVVVMGLSAVVCTIAWCELDRVRTERAHAEAKAAEARFSLRCHTTGVVRMSREYAGDEAERAARGWSEQHRAWYGERAVAGLGVTGNRFNK